MTNEEHLNVHEQMIASIERNLGALVEAQQRTEQRVGELSQRVNELSRVVASILEIQRDTFGMIQRVVDRVEQQHWQMDRFNERMGRVEKGLAEMAERGAATDQRLDRLAETVQRFLDSQTGRNGQQ